MYKQIYIRVIQFYVNTQDICWIMNTILTNIIWYFAETISFTRAAIHIYMLYTFFSGFVCISFPFVKTTPVVFERTRKSNLSEAEMFKTEGWMGNILWMISSAKTVLYWELNIWLLSLHFRFLSLITLKKKKKIIVWFYSLRNMISIFVFY